MSAHADGPRLRTDPALRRAVEAWLARDQGAETRLEAVGAVADLADLVGEVLEQRVAEARSFQHTWEEIAAAVGITRQSAHRRWRQLDGLADAMAADRERHYRPRPPQKTTEPPVPVEDWDTWRPA